MPFNVNKDEGAPMNPSRKGGNSGGPFEILAFIAKGILDRLSNPFKVILPSNHFNPVGTDSFDIRALDVFLAGEKKTLMSYVAKDGQTIRFIKYGFYNNVVKADDVRLFPTINGNRILRYHGDPNQDFAINLSVGPDLTEDSLIYCDFELKSGQKLEIVAENLSGVQVDIGGRFRGYLLNANEPSRGFGG